MKIGGRDILVQGRLVRIARPELDKYEFLADPEVLIGELKKSDARADLFTFMQLPPHFKPEYSYPMEWDNLAILDVTSFEHWWRHQIRSYARNRARQAERKGVTVREADFDENLVHGMWKVYNESPVRQGKPNVHYGKDVQTVRKEGATFLDRSVFIGAFLQEELIGFAKLVTNENRTQANLMNIVSMMKHRDKAPTNALIAQAVRSCAERRIQYLLYQNFTYGKKRPDSLTNFKEVNGFQRIDLPRYYVPLTRIGRAVLRFGFQHGLVNRLPEGVAARLREIRSAWYNRKLPSVISAQEG